MVEPKTVKPSPALLSCLLSILDGSKQAPSLLTVTFNQLIRMTAQAKAAKDNLDLAVTSYRYNVAMVKRTLQSTSLNERTLSNKFQALSESLASLSIAHTT